MTSNVSCSIAATRRRNMFAAFSGYYTKQCTAMEYVREEIRYICTWMHEVVKEENQYSTRTNSLLKYTCKSDVINLQLNKVQYHHSKCHMFTIGRHFTTQNFGRYIVLNVWPPWVHRQSVAVFRRVRKIEESDYKLRHFCPSVRPSVHPNRTTRLPLERFS